MKHVFFCAVPGVPFCLAVRAVREYAQRHGHPVTLEFAGVVVTVLDEQ